jgi:hypothetical protein
MGQEKEIITTWSLASTIVLCDHCYLLRLHNGFVVF